MIREHLAFVAVAAFLSALSAESYAATLAGWDVSGLTAAANGFGPSPFAPTTQAPEVTVGGLTRGSGVGTGGTAANRAWGGNDWTSPTADAAITANDFATFSITPNAGQTISFSSVSKFDYRRSGTGPDAGVLQAQVGSGSFFDVATLAFTSSSSSGASLSAIDLSTFPSLQNVPVGTTVTFRIVNFRVASAGGAAGTWYIFDKDVSPALDLAIEGTLGAGPSAGVVITETGGSTTVTEGGVTDTYTINVNTIPTASVNIDVQAGPQLELSTDGMNYASSLDLVFSSTAPQTVHVRALDDALVESSPHPGSVSHTVTSADASYNGLAVRSVNVSITDNDVGPGLLRIHDIQGAAHLSSLSGTAVQNVPGTVTALRSNGFYFQDPEPDANPATSEGIFVFTSSRPSVAVGDSLLVSGNVAEFRPGSDNENLTITEITSPVTLVRSSGNPLPAPVVLGPGGRAIPTTIIADDASGGNVENSATVFDPENDGIDFYESLEGMLVQVNNPVASGPSNDFGELPVLADNGSGATSRSASGGSLVAPTDFNPERIILDNELGSSTPLANVGDKLSTVVGVMDYSFGNFKLYFTQPVSLLESTLTRETADFSGDAARLTIATFNVENLDPADGAAKFTALALHIVNSLRSPDIINLEEVQDNNGPVNDSVVDANATLEALVTAIVAAGGPAYQYRQINPADDQDGGEPGGNIRVAFLFSPNRVQFVDRPGGSSTSATAVLNVAGSPQLSASPGRIEPTDPAFNSSRKPLVGEFIFEGKTLFVIGNHFNSKGGDQPLFGRFQPPTLFTETQRMQQAQIVRDFVQEILTVDSRAHVVVLGDLNDFQFSNPVNLLKSVGLTDLIELLPANEQYTYVFEGNSQVLDHILAANLHAEVDVVHFNSEFADQVSDHDPVVARFLIDGPPVAGVSCQSAPGGDVLTLSAFDTVTASPEIYVVDSVSGFVAGPFASGDQLYLQIMPTGHPYSKEFPHYAARLHFNGPAIVIAVDEAGQESSPAVCE